MRERERYTYADEEGRKKERKGQARSSDIQAGTDIVSFLLVQYAYIALLYHYGTVPFFSMRDTESGGIGPILIVVSVLVDLLHDILCLVSYKLMSLGLQ